MQSATFSEFRRRAKKYFDAVEQGETINISRHGKIIAKIVPEGKTSQPSWKKPALRLKIDGVELSRIILEERDATE